MRPKRQFDIELLQELKLFTHCKKKIKNPNHYCTQKELATNLKMSQRDVSKTLHEMVEKGIIIHETYTNEKHAKSDKFYPARKFTDKEIMRPFQNALKIDLEIMKDLASKMRKNPAFHSFKMIENYMGKSYEEMLGAIKNKQGIFQSRSNTGKINKKGYNMLLQFCEFANQVFSTVDSLSYATSENTLEDNNENEKIIRKLRMNVYNEIHDLVEYSIRPCPARQQNEIRSNIYMRVRQLFLINEMRKQTRIKN